MSLSGKSARYNDLTESEIQTLIGMIELSRPVTTPNNSSEYIFFPKTEEDAKKYFGRFTVKWEDAYKNLIKHSYIENNESGYCLTEDGYVLASLLRLERSPLWYAYKGYYIDADQSNAHANFCKKVFGENLCQDGFADMKQ